ncbi:MAG: glycoside hydrolase family 2 protein [Promethearchaeota archaeon]
MSIKNNFPKPEYPRPQLVRNKNWINLNGEWDFAFDDENIGLRKEWYKKENERVFDKKIIVPFCFQCPMSGIGDNNFHDVIWYKRVFNLPENFYGNRVLLNFEAVDYECKVFLNDKYIGSHVGGYTGFNFDITNYLKEENYLVLRVFDPSKDCEIPRGKQFWRKKPSLIYYPRVSGIWQTVWVECVHKEFYIKDIKFHTDIENSIIIIECDISGIGNENLFLQTTISYKGKELLNFDTNLSFLGKYGKSKKGKNILRDKLDTFQRLFDMGSNPNKFKLKVEIPKEELYLWDIKSPNLYDLTLKLHYRENCTIFDEIQSYFGMRKISISKNANPNKKILLNNKPIYQKLVLVQGYWKDSYYTAPSEDAIIKDLDYLREFGFNGLRAHQKTFEQRFLYWCDKMGILVWAEIGSVYAFSTKSQSNFINQYLEMINRDFNHPSIIVWVLLNEGWGLNNPEIDNRCLDYTLSLYHMFKSIDPDRLIIDDDGWWHAKTDICSKHFYLPLQLLPKSFEEEKKFNGHEPILPKFYIKPYNYYDEPIIYSEIGGIAFDLEGNLKKYFGQDKVNSKDELVQKLENLFNEFKKRTSWIQGFCYTELYDQFQEINGLLTMERKPKFLPKRLRKILEEF